MHLLSPGIWPHIYTCYQGYQYIGCYTLALHHHLLTDQHQELQAQELETVQQYIVSNETDRSGVKLDNNLYYISKEDFLQLLLPSSVPVGQFSATSIEN